MNWGHYVWVNSHSTYSHTEHKFTESAELRAIVPRVCLCFISITFSCSVFLCAFPGCWIVYTLSFMVPSLLLEQWRLGRTWVLNKALRPDTCGLWTDSSFVAEARGVGVGGQGPGTLGEERQAKGAPWEKAWANNHNNTSTRAPVIQWSRAGRKVRNGTTAKCQWESRNPVAEGDEEQACCGKPKRQSEQMIECWREEKGRRMKRKADFMGGLLTADKGMWKKLWGSQAV